MNETKHTPGPWKAENCGNGLIVTCKAENDPETWSYDGKLNHRPNIATINNMRLDAGANAALIASAPDLLEALGAMLNLDYFPHNADGDCTVQMMDGDCEVCKALVDAREIIANATSEGIENCDILAAARSAICKTGRKQQ